MKIGLFGAASSEIDSKYIDAGFELGKTIGAEGMDIVYGGGATGMMGAVARGLKEVGGSLIGVVPEYFKETLAETLCSECDELIYTEDMLGRIAEMEKQGDAFVIMPGGTGTYQEFFCVLISVIMGRHSKPIVLFDVDGFFEPLLAMLNDGVDKKFIPPERVKIARAFDEKHIPELLNYIKQNS